MLAILKTVTCWFALLLILGACETAGTGHDGGVDQYRLSNHDIEMVADFAFGPNDQLIRWERSIEFELGGEQIHRYRKVLARGLTELGVQVGVGARPVSIGERANFRVFVGEQYFLLPRQFTINADYFLESEACDMSMKVNEFGQIEEVLVFINDNPNNGLQPSTLEDKLSILNCLVTYPFFGAFGGLGVTIPPSTGLSKSYRATTKFDIVMSAIYTPGLQAGMKKSEAIQMLRVNPTVRMIQ